MNSLRDWNRGNGWSIPDGGRQFGDLLALTTLLTYAVIATGATLGSTASAKELVGLGHGVLTGLAGLILAVTLVTAWRQWCQRRTRVAVTAGAVLFVVQAVVGALVLTTGAVPAHLHLLIGGGVFACLLLGLGWTLEANTPRGSPGTQPETNNSPSTSVETTPATEGSNEDNDADGAGARARAYLELTKPRLMWLLCLLSLAGIALATTTGAWPDGVTVAATLAGGVLAIGASGTFNHVLERDRDSEMERTADRPVATDRIPRENALVFGVALLGLSVSVLWILVTPLATLLTVAAVVYYSVIYTVVLKPNTTWNIAIGGGAGALPAVIGWAAVTGSVGLPAVALAAVVVLWTPAHFYNLAIVYREDYARAGFPMYPVVSGVSAARRRILLTLGLTLLATTTLAAITPLGWLFTGATLLAGGVFLAAVVSQCRRRTDEATLRSFHASNAYLGTVLLAILAEALLWLP